MGIEPTLFAWEAKVLPLNYTRLGSHQNGDHRHGRTPLSEAMAAF